MKVGLGIESHWTKLLENWYSFQHFSGSGFPIIAGAQRIMALATFLEKEPCNLDLKREGGC